MRVIIETQVKGNYKDIMSRFDRKLFEALKPKNADMEIVEFTGSRKGDCVHLRFNKPLKAEWVSLITEHGENDHEAWFVDEGTKLPFPLAYWKHKHIVRKITDRSSLIIDDITFKGNNFLLTALLRPVIYLGFAPRKKVYREYFNK
jgi:ligand-binding SRPBCC domain-containing protein